MNTRLKDKLNAFLIQYDLSMQSRIFEDSIATLAGLQDIDLKKRKKFYSVHRFSDSSSYCFRIPTLSQRDKNALFAFCGFITDNDLDSEIEISEEVLSEKIIPLFEKHIDTLSKQSSSVLKPYQLLTKSKFVKNAIESIEFISSDILREINFIGKEVSESEKKLSMVLFQIKGIFLELKTNLYFYAYPYVFDAIQMLKQILAELAVNANHTVNVKRVNNLFANLEKYIRYNDAEAHLRSDKIFSDLNKFLFDKKISINECDIFENVLLKLAGVTRYTRCKVDKNHDDMSCIFLGVGDLSREDTEKFLQFFHLNGASSAIVTDSCYEYTPVNPAERENDSDSESEYGGRNVVAHLPYVSFSVSTQELDNKILPIFKSEISRLESVQPAFLVPYKNDSKRCFKEEIKVVANNPATLFHQENAVPVIGSHPVLENANILQDKDATENVSSVGFGGFR